MCFGVFDSLHLGHLFYLKQAKKYGDQLIVVVARDKNVLKVKGRLPGQKEKIRREIVKNTGLSQRVVLGQLRDKFKVVTKYKPDVICLGYDQVVNTDKLKKVSPDEIIRLKSYKPNIYKSSKLINAKNF